MVGYLQIDSWFHRNYCIYRAVTPFSTRWEAGSYAFQNWKIFWSFLKAKVSPSTNWFHVILFQTSLCCKETLPKVSPSTNCWNIHCNQIRTDIVLFSDRNPRLEKKDWESMRKKVVKKQKYYCWNREQGDTRSREEFPPKA